MKERSSIFSTNQDLMREALSHPLVYCEVVRTICKFKINNTCIVNGLKTLNMWRCPDAHED